MPLLASLAAQIWLEIYVNERHAGEKMENQMTEDLVTVDVLKSWFKKTRQKIFYEQYKGTVLK